MLSFSQQLVGRFFRDVVAAGQGAASHIGGAFAPKLEDIEIGTYCAMLTPEDAKRYAELFVGGNIQAVML